MTKTYIKAENKKSERYEGNVLSEETGI